MSDNQYVFEIIRDVGHAIQNIEINETLWLNVKRDDFNFFTARASKAMPTGVSETSQAIRKAYDVTRNVPDERDVEIKQLREALEFYVDEAKAIAKNFGKNDHALIASLNVLVLDNGRRGDIKC